MLIRFFFKNDFLTLIITSFYSKMILIDALYINNGGGKILLDYLIEEIEKRQIKVQYLLDDRIKNNIPQISKLNEITFIEGNFFKRHRFYIQNKNKFSKVFCFGNLPPTIRLNAQVYTYFQLLIYLSIRKEFSFIDQVKFRLKRLILKNIAKNTNYWIVQSNLVKEKLFQKFQFESVNIIILPFYPKFGVIEVPVRAKHTYFYASNASPHKNHSRLIEVFCQWYDKYKLGKLTLTVNDDYQSILELIELKQKLGYPIKNIGFVGREELHKEYLSSEFLIFPSLTESFGLGLIEAVECGCKVIGADLPYTYEVCEPSIVFNPEDDESFIQAFENSLSEDVKISIPKIKNNINELINILKDITCN